MILIVSSEHDVHTQAVHGRLCHMGTPVTLVDLAEFPQQTQIALKLGAGQREWQSTFADYERDLQLDDCRAIWWRLPQPFVLHPELTDQHYRAFAFAECHATLAGLWLAHEAFWVNHPLRNEAAARRAYQLKAAQGAGLTIPATLITNSPSQARAFVAQHGYERVVYRTFSATANTWRETRLLRPHQMALLDNVCYAPVIFQEYVPARAILRIVAVGEALFAAICPLYGPILDPVLEDEGQDSLSTCEPYRLPTPLAAQIRALLTHLDLTYATIHLRVTPTGQPVFLELDPTGGWLDLEESTNLPITQALATLLHQQDRAAALSRIAAQPRTTESSPVYPGAGAHPLGHEPLGWAVGNGPPPVGHRSWPLRHPSATISKA
jgi:hypothetical protein